MRPAVAPSASFGGPRTRRRAEGGPDGRFRGAPDREQDDPAAHRASAPRASARSTSSKLRDETGLHHARPGLRQHRLVPERDHLHRRREGHPALPRLPDRGARREEHVPRGRLPADLRRAADAAAARRLHARRSRYHTMLHEDFKRFFGALPKDAHPMAGVLGGGRRARDLLPRLARPARRAPGRDLRAPADREDADDRGLRVQALDRPAVHVPRQPARLRRRTSCT